MGLEQYVSIVRSSRGLEEENEADQRGLDLRPMRDPEDLLRTAGLMLQLSTGWVFRTPHGAFGFDTENAPENWRRRT